MKALANVIWYSTTFVQKSQKSLVINLLTRSSLHIKKLYPVNNPKLTEIFTPIHSRLVAKLNLQTTLLNCISATLHKSEKQFQCEICNAEFTILVLLHMKVKNNFNVAFCMIDAI